MKTVVCSLTLALILQMGKVVGAPNPVPLRLSATIDYQQIGARDRPHPPLLEVTVGTEDAVRLLFDTGAPISVISERLARRLGIPIRKLSDVNARRFPAPGVVGEATLPPIKLGAVKLGILECLVMSSDQLSALYEAPVDGILGANFAVQVAVHLDTTHHQMTLWYPGGLSTGERKAAGFADAVAVPLGDGEDPFAVTVRFAAGLPMQMQLDTGSDTTTIPGEVAQRLLVGGVTTNHKSSTMYGDRTEKEATISGLSIGGVSVGPARVRFTEGPDDDFDHLLGLNILSRYDLLIDPAIHLLFTKHLVRPEIGTTSSSYLYSVPMAETGGNPLPAIQVFLDDGKPHIFGFSAAAPQSLVDESVVRLSGLPVKTVMEDGRQYSTIYTAVRAGGDSLARVEMVAVPAIWRKGSHSEVEGILGASLLNLMALRLDFGRRTLDFTIPGRPIPKEMRPPSWKRVPLLWRDGIFGVKGVLDGQNLILRVGGLDALTSISCASFDPPLKPEASAEFVGDGLKFVRFRRLVLGAQEWRQPIVVNQSDEGAFRGTLGLDFLRSFHVILDFPGRCMYLAPDPQVRNDPLRWVSSGARLLWTNGGKLVVSSIARGSSAEAEGMLIGDEVIAIDATAVAGLALENLSALQKRPEGTEVEYRVHRVGVDHPLTFRVRVRKLL